MKIAITIPKLNKMGGVASFYNSILPYLKNNSSLEIVCFNIGSKAESSSLLHPVTDQIRFKKILRSRKSWFGTCEPVIEF